MYHYRGTWYEQNGKVQFWLKYTYSFLFTWYIGSSDHIYLQFYLLCYSTRTKASISRYSLCQAKILTSREIWFKKLTGMTFCHHWISAVLGKYFQRLEVYWVHWWIIPQDFPRRKSIFMNRRALNLKNRKCKLWNKYICSKSSDDYISYCQVRNELCNLTRHLRTNYENKLVSGAKENPRQLWKYIN